jgi:predicted MFS family arabinose efflux permease
MLLLLVVALALRWAAYDALALLAAQLVAGAALGVVGLNAFALVADAYGRRQAQALGIVNASLSLGQVAGYLVAGTAGAWVGWRPMSALLVLLPTVVLALVLAAPPPMQAERTTARPGLGRVLTALVQPQRLAFAGLAALTLSAGQGATYLLPFAVQTRDLGPLAAAVLLIPYVAGSVVAAPLSGVLADRYGTRSMILGALLLGTATLVALGWAQPSAAGYVLMGAAVNSTLPLAAVRVIAIGGSRGGVGSGISLAGLRIGQSLGPFLGPTVAGVLLARYGVGLAWLALAGCLAISLALHEAGSHAPATRP